MNASEGPSRLSPVASPFGRFVDLNGTDAVYPPRLLQSGGCLPAFTFFSYHLNISEKKNFPKAGSVSVLDMKFRNSSALLRKASLMLASNFSATQENTMLFVFNALRGVSSSSSFPLSR